MTRNVSRHVVLAVLSGVSFSLIGVAYGFGRRSGVRPVEIVLVSAFFGSVYFLARHWLETVRGRRPWQIPARVLGWGVVGGLSQYLTLRIVGKAIQLGPLSPLWCAVSLSFIPVSIYSVIRYQERLSAPRLLAIIAGGSAVVVSALANSRGGVAILSFQGALGYAVVLLTILVLNSLSNLAIKTLGMPTSGSHGNQTAVAGDLFLLTMYLVSFLAVFTDRFLTHHSGGDLGAQVALGLLAALGSIGGCSLLIACARGPAGVVFTVSGISGVLAASLISVFFLGERISFGWCATIGLGILSIAFGACSD